MAAEMGCLGAESWRDRAACRSEDSELFFPVGASGPVLLQIAEAKTVCRSCPVVPQCLEAALLVAASGVWGGLSEDEREAVLRDRRQAATSRKNA
jgi:WhiB family transcriptional regulator, redox-sensing transcriptional regulator